MRLIGLDPGLRSTGWGVIDIEGSALRHVASGDIRPPVGAPLAERLLWLFDGVAAAVSAHGPAEAAVEETFVSRNASSTLKLGHARAAVMLAPARAGIPVAEYAANHIKKSLVGSGHAAKRQVQAMVRVLLPAADTSSSDTADALAAAICHAHNRSTHAALREAVEAAT